MTYVEDQDIADIPDYPNDWTSDQRVAAYWHAVNFTHLPTSTEQWYSVWKSLEREQERRQRVTKQEVG